MGCGRNPDFYKLAKFHRVLKRRKNVLEGEGKKLEEFEGELEETVRKKEKSARLSRRPATWHR